MPVNGAFGICQFVFERTVIAVKGVAPHFVLSRPGQAFCFPAATVIREGIMAYEEFLRATRR